MTSLKSLRAELEELRADIMSKREKSGEQAAPDAHESGIAVKPLAALENQIGELNKMVKKMLDDAETTVGDHPVATVAGALALGIVIGRLTAR